MKNLKFQYFCINFHYCFINCSIMFHSFLICFYYLCFIFSYFFCSPCCLLSATMGNRHFPGSSGSKCWAAQGGLDRGMHNSGIAVKSDGTHTRCQHMYTCKHRYTHVCVCVCVCACARAHAYAGARARARARACVRARVCVRACACV